MNPKSQQFDSQKIPTHNNGFEDYIKNGVNKDAAPVVGGRRQPDSQRLESVPTGPVATPFDDYINGLKKKDVSAGQSGSGVEQPPEVATSSSNGDKRKTSIQDAKSFVDQDLANTSATPAATNGLPGIPGVNSPAQPAQRPDANPFIDRPVPTPQQEAMQSPEKMGQYLTSRRQVLEQELLDLDRRKNVEALNFTVAGPGAVPTPSIKDKVKYDEITGQINQKKAYLDKLQNSFSELIGDRVVAESLAKNKYAIANPMAIGRKIVELADKKSDEQFKALEGAGKQLGGVQQADLELAGIRAVKRYLQDNEELENRDALVKEVNERERSFEERNFELTGARIRHKLGAVLQKESGWSGNIFRRAPSVEMLVDAAKKANLSPGEQKVFNSYVLPTEKRNLGTDIPMSGFLNKFGEAIHQGVGNLGNVFRSDNERLGEALNQEIDTRFDEVGEFGRDKNELRQLKKQEKTKEGISEGQKTRIKELENYNDVRQWYNKFWDGSGDLTGQVVFQASVARLFGGVTAGLSKVASKAPAVAGLLSKAPVVNKDMANLMFTSFLNSYDGHAKEAVQLMPNKDQYLQRRMYSWTMAAVEGLSERIFPDTKVLDAFRRTIAPDVVRLAGRLSAREISEEAAKGRLRDIISNRLTPFAKSFVKAEVSEGVEEGVVDIATGISETVFGGKDFDSEETFGNAADTFLTTMAYSPFVAGMASVKDVRAGSYGKSGLYKMATDPDTYRREVTRQLADPETELSQEEADQKLHIINTAASIANQLPGTKEQAAAVRTKQTIAQQKYEKEMARIDAREDVSDEAKQQAKDLYTDIFRTDMEKIQAETTTGEYMDYPERATYLTHRLNEALLEERMANETDDVVKTDLQRQIDRSKKIREGIYKGDIIIGNNLEEIAVDPKTAEELGITSVENADDDSLPNNIPLTQTENNEISEQQAGPTEQQTGSESESNADAEERPAQEQTGGESQEGVTPEVTPEVEGAVTLPPGMTQKQFNSLPKSVQEKLMAMVNKPAAAPATERVEENIPADPETIAEANNIQAAEDAGIAAADADLANESAIDEQTARELQEFIENDILSPDNRDLADTDPQGFLRYVAQQANNVTADGQRNTSVDTTLGAKAQFGEQLIDLANKAFPEYSFAGDPAQQEQPAAQQPAQQPTREAGVSYEPVASISTDVQRFQPREANYSQESVDKIVNTFDDNSLDPIVLYRDPNGQQYVLAGHSRLEAHNQLSNLPDTDPRKQRAVENGFQPGNIKARYFQGTEAEARAFADRSNDLGTRNLPRESAASIRTARATQEREAVQQRAKTDFGKSWRSIWNMSFLNPNGKAMQTVRQFEGTEDQVMKNEIDRATNWIGAVRDRLGAVITDAHENEMFDFLMDGNRSTDVTRENDFIRLVENITGAFDFNPNNPLNLARIKNKSAAEFAYDQEEKELKEAIRERQAAMNDLDDRFNNPKNPRYISTRDADYQETNRAATQQRAIIKQQLDLLRREMLDLKERKGQILAAGIQQRSLFEMPPAEEAAEINNELQSDGITVDQIQAYEQQQTIDTDPGELPAQDTGVNEQTQNVPEDVQEPVNDESGSTQQDPVGTTVQGQERASPPVDPLQEEMERKTRAIAEAKAAFRDSLRKSRGNLNVGFGIDPEVIANGVKLMAAYADAGITKFKQVIQDIADTFGAEFFDAQNVEALKGVYAYYRANEPRESRNNYDNEDIVDDFIDNELKEIYEPSSPANLESDRTRTNTANPVRERSLSSERRASDPANTEDGKIIADDVQPLDSPGLLPFDATSVRATSDTGLPVGERQPGSEPSPARDPDSRRGDPLDEAGIPAVSRRTDSVEGALASLAGLSDDERLELQKKAMDIPIIPMDMGNIQETLPILLPGQHGDVMAAEQRFYGQANDQSKLFGKGILFTNGTGTGKTLTGLGTMNRAVRMGKPNHLILAPTEGVIQQWVAAGDKFFGMTVNIVPSTTSAGTPDAINITTYANFRANPLIQQRDWDSVTADESHKLFSNGQGDVTSAYEAFKEAVNVPSVAFRKSKEAFNYNQRLQELEKARDGEGIRNLNRQVRQDAINKFKQSKVMFLSATPFSYHPNLKYADGVLFPITETFDETENKTLGYNEPGAEAAFYMRNFGYRMRYNKLTIPESGVDKALMERQFTEGLKKDGVIVSRVLDIDKDYSRQFIQADTEIGRMIDEGFDKMTDHEKYPRLSQHVNKHFNFLVKNRIMEALKARWAVDRIKKHMELGRKVVVFHTYLDNEPKHPFRFSAIDLVPVFDNDFMRLQSEIEQFNAENPEYGAMDLSGLKSPIQTLQEAFGDKVAIYNGKVSKKNKEIIKNDFNNDNGTAQIIVLQYIAGQEGISLHDTTGKNPRVLMNLGLPYMPSTAIQAEGRIYRTGNASDAVDEYPVLGLNFEKNAYAEKIATRSGTVENLALGEKARDMETAFKEGYLNATNDQPSLSQGKGGKSADSRLDQATEFEKAKSYYYSRGKRTAQQKAQVEADYYATPEPLGSKMAEWLGLVPSERALEPSAGHGAISRFFSGRTKNTFIEPNNTLRGEAAMRSIGNAHAGNFEELNIINKYDGIAMNPPFGVAGKLAMDHLLKATRHLADGGRIVALVPTGKMNDRIAQWQDSPESEGFYVRARIQLPMSTFERAGTKVATQIIVIDKVLDDRSAGRLGQPRYSDLSKLGSINELFDTIENMSVPNRLNPGQSLDQEAQEDMGAAAAVAEGLTPGNEVAEIIKNYHVKNQRDNYVVKLNKKLSSEEYAELASVAKDFGGNWSSYRKDGAVPGFQFPTPEGANKLMAAINGTAVQDAPKMSLADKIRAWKIASRGSHLYSSIIPVVPIWNAAVEIVALAVQGGTALADALTAGKLYIEKNYQKPWQRAKYNQEMIGELQRRGVLQYNLSDSQRQEADDIMSRISTQKDLLKEIIQLDEGFEIARNLLTDPNDIAELEENQREFERFLWDGLAAQELAGAQRLNLGLKNQNFWQKLRTGIQNRYERVETVQKAITDAGLTIDQHNDMLNAQDRWQSIANAKIQNELRRIGLSDLDIFVWKGQKKITDSMFDRMKKDGVDYRGFNLYLYALHAPERNAFNAKLRRERFAQHLALFRSAGDQKNIDAYETYEAAYNDPTQNPNKIKLLEKSIDPEARLLDDGGSGMTNQQAADILAEVGNSGNLANFQKYAAEVRSMIDRSLDLRLEYGLIDQQNHTNLKAAYQNYVPLSVDNDYMAEVEGFDKRTPGATIYKSRGSATYDFEKRTNPLTSAIINMQSVIYAGEQNRYKNTIAATIRTAPDPDVWEIRAARYAPQKDQDGKLVGLQELPLPAELEGKTLDYMDDGQKKYLVFNDPALAKAMTGSLQLSAVPLLAKFNGVFRGLWTVYNPEFTITNLVRDIQTAGIVLSATAQKGITAEYLKNMPRMLKIIRAAYRSQKGTPEGISDTEWTKLAQEYREMGGEMAYYSREDISSQRDNIEEAQAKYEKTGGVEAAKNLAVRMFNVVSKANQAVENATRLAMYDAMVKNGIAKYKAVEMARNATINFQKAGNWSPLINSGYLFFNAGIQGSYNLFKSMLTTKRGAKLAAGLATLGVLQSFLNRAFGDCEGGNPADCYDNIKDYEKERNLIFKNPFGTGFWKIPMPYGFNVFVNIGEQLAEVGQGKQFIDRAGLQVLKSTMNSFNPLGSSDTPLLQQISPTALDPLVQISTNEDSFGRDIVSKQRYDKRPDALTTNSGDSDGAKRLAAWMGSTTGGNEKVKGKIDVAPGTLDWMFETVTGGLGTFVGKVTSTTGALFNPDVDVDPKKIPVLSRFYTAPKEVADKGFIYDMLDQSGNTILERRDQEQFEREVQKGERLGTIDPKQAKQFRSQVNKSQYELTNPNVTNMIEASKARKLDESEIDAFVEGLQFQADGGQIPAEYPKRYRTQIRKNQSKFKND